MTDGARPLDARPGFDPLAISFSVAPEMRRCLPHAVLATMFVTVVPTLGVWAIAPSHGLVRALVSPLLAVFLSVAAASAGSAVWQRRPGSRDLVFGDLMLWGWLRRSRTERRLADARNLLEPRRQAAPELSFEDRVEALKRVGGLLEARDAGTHGHSQRVTRHAERIARAMHLSPAEVAKVRTAAAVHDVGKIHTPRAILNKPGRLTDEEFAAIKRHPVDGADMSSAIGDPEITAMVRHHHERLDGAGYPDGLAGEEIPLGARIIAVADTFDAMTSARAYRAAATHKKALDVLSSESGTQLDAGAVAAFLGYYSGKRSVVAWSAVGPAASQRLFSWLGGTSRRLGTLAVSALPAAGAAAVAASSLGTAAAPLQLAHTGHRARSVPAHVSATLSAAWATTPGTTRTADHPSRPRLPRDAVDRSPGASGSSPPVAASQSQRSPSTEPIANTTEKPVSDPTPPRSQHDPTSDAASNLISKITPHPTSTPPPELPHLETPTVEVAGVQAPAIEATPRVPPVNGPSLPVDVPSLG